MLNTVYGSNTYENSYIIDPWTLDVCIRPKCYKSMQFSGPSTWRQYAVVQSFKHAWKGYKEHAWGHDNVKPVSGMISDWFSLGLTIVDSIDTAYIMGLHEGNIL